MCFEEIEENLDLREWYEEYLIDDFYYWHISGIKGFSKFSRQFRNIKITEENQEYSIVELEKEQTVIFNKFDR